MTPIPLITGTGLATALGNTLDATWHALCAGKAITSLGRVPGIEPHGEPRVNVLALRVAHEAIARAGWDAHALASAALIVGTSKGACDDWIERWGSSFEESPGRSLDCVHDKWGLSQSRGFGLGETATALAGRLGIAGPRMTLSAACASGLHALIHASMMIRAGRVARALVVGCESSLHPLFLASFRRLGVLAPDGHGCRPFDQSRAGFVVSEAAAAICLESAEGPKRSHERSVAVEGYALGADATHLTHADPSGAVLRALLARVFDGRKLDLIHAHGTGTIANDPVELAAIESCLSNTCPIPPSLYSHKGALGHSLGAAGLVSVALNCAMHSNGRVLPNVRTADALPHQSVTISQTIARRPISRSAAIAAGFGGSIAAVTLHTQEW